MLTGCSFHVHPKLKIFNFSCNWFFLVKEDIDQDNNAKKAHRTYLKGRTLNVVPDHSPEAEQLLSKAVKLEPNLVDAWIELGECYWKRGDVETAKTCFEGALSHVSSDSFAKEYAYNYLGINQVLM